MAEESKGDVMAEGEWKESGGLEEAYGWIFFS